MSEGRELSKMTSAELFALADVKLKTLKGRRKMAYYSACYLKDLMRRGTMPDGHTSQLVVHVLEALSQPFELAMKELGNE